MVKKNNASQNIIIIILCAFLVTAIFKSIEIFVPGTLIANSALVTLIVNIGLSSVLYIFVTTSYFGMYSNVVDKKNSAYKNYLIGLLIIIAIAILIHFVNKYLTGYYYFKVNENLQELSAMAASEEALASLQGTYGLVYGIYNYILMALTLFVNIFISYYFGRKIVKTRSEITKVKLSLIVSVLTSTIITTIVYILLVVLLSFISITIPSALIGYLISLIMFLILLGVTTFEVNSAFSNDITQEDYDEFDKVNLQNVFEEPKQEVINNETDSDEEPTEEVINNETDSDVETKEEVINNETDSDEETKEEVINNETDSDEEKSL